MFNKLEVMIITTISFIAGLTIGYNGARELFSELIEKTIKEIKKESK